MSHITLIPILARLLLLMSQWRRRWSWEGRKRELEVDLFCSFTACPLVAAPSTPSAYENLDVQTHSNPAAFPSALRAKRALVVKPEDEEFANPLPVVSTPRSLALLTSQRNELHDLY